MKRCNRNATIFAVTDEHTTESSQQPTRETATGGASRAVLEYGWASLRLGTATLLVYGQSHPISQA